MSVRRPRRITSSRHGRNAVWSAIKGSPGSSIWCPRPVIAYATRAGIQYDVELPQARRIKPKAYADNFKYGRIENWTH